MHSHLGLIEVAQKLHFQYAKKGKKIVNFLFFSFLGLEIQVSPLLDNATNQVVGYIIQKRYPFFTEKTN